MKLIRTASVLAALMLSGAVVAEDWDWKVAPYLWLAGVEGDGNGGEVPFDIELDLLDVLDAGALLWVEASKEQHTLYGDLIFLALEPDADETRFGTPFDADLDAFVINAGYWRNLGTGDSSSGPVFGLRYWDIDLTTETTVLPDFSGGESWLDGVIGWRHKRPINDRWHLTLLGDVGAGGSDLTVQAMGLFSRQLDSGNQFSLGYRVLKVDYTDDDTEGFLRPLSLDLTFHGLIFGYVFD